MSLRLHLGSLQKWQPFTGQCSRKLLKETDHLCPSFFLLELLSIYIMRLRARKLGDSRVGSLRARVVTMNLPPDVFILRKKGKASLSQVCSVSDKLPNALPNRCNIK